GAGDPIHSRVAMRVIPRATDPHADRLYVASGNKLLAMNPAAGGTKGWSGQDSTAAFTTSAEITAGPVAVNFGSKTNPSYLDLVVYVGTSDGTFYALNDSAVEFDGETPLPGGPDVVTRSVVGSVTSIAVWSEPTDDTAPGRHLGESVFVGTSEGNLYAFAASNLSLIWERTFGPAISIRMASAPMNPPNNPSYSSALMEDGKQLFLNSTTVYVTSSSGFLYSIARDAVGTLSAGTVKWRFADKVPQERGFRFTAPPVLAVSQRIIFGVGVDPKGTADPSDDQGTLYSLSEVGDLLWRKDFDATLDA